MDTQILKIASIFENPDELQQAADILARGGLVAFPTETVYGLGANGLDEEAVRSIYQAKGRPSDNPLILHICDTEMRLSWPGKSQRRRSSWRWNFGRVH